ncbi:type II toxin-antitoxin system RelE/ParE family toxin [Planctomyces sp. SH-PL14]|uniref:type II toxin-antitoxin system RelE/ParE family toxin n=1 Tax=Planctomyces sp. SH-PL14 TaxID=1632864 RepID=UPI00078D11CC|nr:type II toxin-antitoxin system RelE/ParE family toxin [Planctomyces sp. SH-PL14]AMV17633.1 Plasmid stabilization system protein [Planctomyces sp. SH-PL14]
MSHAVRILSRARRDIDEIVRHLAGRSVAGAASWIRALDRALKRLSDHAESCSLAAEDEFVAISVREILFKTRRGRVYRMLFTIREGTVFVMHVRAPGRDFVGEGELEDPELES